MIHSTPETHQLQLGIVSDEISTDFETAVRFGKSWGIQLYELRQVRSGRIPNIEMTEWKEILHIIKRERINVTALSPGILKAPLSNTDEINRNLTEDLPRSIERAHEVGAKAIIVFGFERERDEAPDNFYRAVEAMRKAASIAEANDVRIAIENEYGFWCDSGTNTTRFIRAVDSPVVKANWDPCNAYGCDEEPFPDGYNAVKEYICNVHVKDTRAGSTVRCVPVGEGVIDWRKQIGAIVKDRIVGHVTIETHCVPLIEKSKINVDRVNAILQTMYMI